MRFSVLAAVITVGVLVTPAYVPVHAQAPPVLLLLSNLNAVDFGPVGVGIASAPQPVTLTNGGGTDLTVSSVAIGGVHSTEFSIVSSSCAVVPPGGVCTVSVAFTPAANGIRSGRLLVTNNAQGSPHMIVLMGRGVDPNVPQRAVGPIDPRHGYPSTFTDEGGISVELCLEGALCLAPVPDPLRPPSVTDTLVNFGPEAFWWSGEAAFDDTANGFSAGLVMAQEAAFQTEIPAVNEQVAFGRVRFRLRGTGVVDGAWYRFTYPFGVAEIQAAPDIFDTSDIGCFASPCDYTQTFTSQISHFLQCVLPAPPVGYLGDFNIPCAVSGSPGGTNYFRVEQISGQGGAVVRLIGETNLFAISGKIAAPPAPPVNRLPIANPDAATVVAGGSVTILVLANDSDADGDPLAVSVATPPANGTAVAVGADIVYTNNGVAGPDSFTYTINDGRGGTATATVSVDVQGANRPPVAFPDTGVTTTNTAVTIAVLTNDVDPDGDLLSIAAVSAGANGSAVAAGGSVTYTPNAGFAGTDTFTYTASDGRGGVADGTVTVTVNAPPLPAGLVLALGFNDTGATTAIDASPFGNHGTIREATRVASRAGFGTALNLDGVNDWVTVADAASLDLTTTMTLEAWVRPTVTTNWRTVIQKERPDGLAYTLYARDGSPLQGGSSTPAGYVRLGFIDQPVRGGPTLQANQWAHLAMTFGGGVLRLYVNGSLASSRTVTGSVVATSNPLRIGGNLAAGEFFAGQIDDVRVYNRALTAQEIQADMNTSLP